MRCCHTSHTRNRCGSRSAHPVTCKQAHTHTWTHNDVKPTASSVVFEILFKRGKRVSPTQRIVDDAPSSRTRASSRPRCHSQALSIPHTAAAAPGGCECGRPKAQRSHSRVSSAHWCPRCWGRAAASLKTCTGRRSPTGVGNWGSSSGTSTTLGRCPPQWSRCAASAGAKLPKPRHRRAFDRQTPRPISKAFIQARSASA